MPPSVTWHTWKCKGPTQSKLSVIGSPSLQFYVFTLPSLAAVLCVTFILSSVFSVAFYFSVLAFPRLNSCYCSLSTILLYLYKTDCTWFKIESASKELKVFKTDMYLSSNAFFKLAKWCEDTVSASYCGRIFMHDSFGINTYIHRSIILRTIYSINISIFLISKMMRTLCLLPIVGGYSCTIHLESTYQYIEISYYVLYSINV